MKKMNEKGSSDAAKHHYVLRGSLSQAIGPGRNTLAGKSGDERRDSKRDGETLSNSIYNGKKADRRENCGTATIRKIPARKEGLKVKRRPVRVKHPVVGKTFAEKKQLKKKGDQRRDMATIRGLEKRHRGGVKSPTQFVAKND